MHPHLDMRLLISHEASIISYEPRSAIYKVSQWQDFTSREVSGFTDLRSPETTEQVNILPAWRSYNLHPDTPGRAITNENQLALQKMKEQLIQVLHQIVTVLS